MACCGQSRSSFRLESVRVSTPPTAPPTSAAPAQRPPLHTGPASPSVILHYTQDTPVLVRGPVSGREYRFSRSDPNHAVDARDADALVRTGLFAPTRTR